MYKILVIVSMHQIQYNALQFPIKLIQCLIRLQKLRKHLTSNQICGQQHQQFQYDIRCISIREIAQLFSNVKEVYTHNFVYLCNLQSEQLELQTCIKQLYKDKKLKLYFISENQNLIKQLYRFSFSNYLFIYLQNRYEDKYEQIIQQTWVCSQKFNRSILNITQIQHHLYTQFTNHTLHIKFRVHNQLIQDVQFKQYQTQISYSNTNRDLIKSNRQIDFECQQFGINCYGLKLNKQNNNIKFEEGKFINCDQFQQGISSTDLILSIRYIDSERKNYEMIKQDPISKQKQQGVLSSNMFQGLIYINNNQNSTIQEQLYYQGYLNNGIRYKNNGNTVIIKDHIQIGFEQQKKVLVIELGMVSARDVQIDRMIQLLTCYYYQSINLKYVTKRITVKSVKQIININQQYDYYEIIVGQGIQQITEQISWLIANWKHQKTFNHQQHNLIIVNLCILPKQQQISLKQILNHYTHIMYMQKTSQGNWQITANSSMKYRNYTPISYLSKLNQNIYELRRDNIGTYIIISKQGEILWCWN